MDSSREQILSSLKGKSILKQNIYDDISKVFKDFKDVVKNTANDLKKEISKVDKRIVIESRDKGDVEVELKVAEDTIIFLMHSDIFAFEKSNVVMKSSYMEEDNERSYCGIILVYNFLSDSFRYDRKNDLGYLIARIFINKDRHFFVEGKRQLGYLFNDFDRAVINPEQIKAIVDAVILYSLEFDLYVPEFMEMNQVTVNEINETNLKIAIATGKRLGFQFKSESDTPE